MVLEKTLESPWTARRSNRPILKEINHEYSYRRTDAEAEALIVWPLMQIANSLKKALMLGKTESKRRGQQRMSWLDGITDSMDMNLSKPWEIAKGREARRAAVHGVSNSQTQLGK